MVFIMVGLTMVFFFVVDKVLQYGEALLVGAAGAK
jgi:preprotein translocase subunit SecE